jgi:subtilisin-like proprotein convertase family protein
MNRYLRIGLVVFVGLGGIMGVNEAARAATITNASTAAALNLAIPDDAYTGALGSMTPSTINVAAVGTEQVISDVTVTIALDHTFVGDLTIKLQSPSGTIVTLLNRPGLFTADNGVQTGGDSSNLSASFPITYDDAASDSAEDMGQGLLDNEVIGDPGNGSPDTYVPDADGANNDFFATFKGENPNGTWTLYIADSAPGATGALQQWSLEITTVPEPASGVLAMMALVPAIGRMTKRTQRLND